MVRRMRFFSSTPLAVGTGRVSEVAPARCWVLRDRMRVRNLWAFSSCCLGGMWGGYRPYFENYTVDASIFDATPSGVVS